MSGSAQQVPTKHDTLQTPAGTGTAVLFECAERSIESFRQSSRFWPPVSTNDPAQGVFETGDYDAVNAGGFRVRMTYSEEANLADIEIKGAGPYYMDLGVDQAMADLKSSLRKCLTES